jgi:hypothetical protein
MSRRRSRGYTAHVQFEAIAVSVKARNLPEAKRKIRNKVSKKKLVPLIDRNNFFVSRDIE